MTKIIVMLLLTLAPAVSAAEASFRLDTLRLADIAAMPPAAVDQPVAVPYRKDFKADNSHYFNAYVLKAVDYLNSNYRLLGYDIHSVLTHNIQYYTYGTIAATNPPLTMCVAAQMEIILTAFDIYSKETGDYSVYSYLPKSSYEGLGKTDIKGHIWVNHDFNSDGTADALINFGMGERRTFENLQPGDFININRTNKTGHAVTFLGFINKTGKILSKYDSTVVGFKYFSSQGKKAAGDGGFDYRYAVFSKFGCPDMPYKNDCNVMYSTDQSLLNTGTMLAPQFWTHVIPQPDSVPGRQSIFNGAYFNGVTTGD